MFCICIIYYSLQVSQRKHHSEKPKEDKIHLLYCIYFQNLHVSGPVQLKPVLFKGQLFLIIFFFKQAPCTARSPMWG